MGLSFFPIDAMTRKRWRRMSKISLQYTGLERGYSSSHEERVATSEISNGSTKLPSACTTNATQSFYGTPEDSNARDEGQSLHVDVQSCAHVDHALVRPALFESMTHYSEISCAWPLLFIIFFSLFTYSERARVRLVVGCNIQRGK